MSITKSDGSTVFVIEDQDISVVQGSTEMYYMCKLFGERSETHVFAPLSQSIPNVVAHSLPFSGALGTFLLNTIFIPYWIWVGYIYKPDIVYAYQNVILPPFILRHLFNSLVVHDMQSDPCDQAEEFSILDGRRDLKVRILLSLTKIGHKFALQRSDLVVALSDELAETLAHNYGINQDDVYIMPLGVDVEKFEPDYTVHEPVSFVYIGSIERYRGVAEFVEGITLLDPDVQENIRVDLYGSGDEDFIQELLADAESQSFQMNWHGLVPHDEIPDRLVDSDVAISPLPEIEAYRVSSPAKVFEYMAAGLPIIASDISPHRKVLTEQFAFITQPTAQGFSEAIVAAVESQGRGIKMGETARIESRNHSWQARFEGLYQSICSVREQ